MSYFVIIVEVEKYITNKKSSFKSDVSVREKTKSETEGKMQAQRDWALKY